MDSDTLRPVALALLAVLAIGLAAATLNSAVVQDGGGFGTGAPDSGMGAPNGSQPGISLGNQSDGPTGSPIDLPCYPVLDTWWAIAAILGAFLLGGYVAYRKFGGIGVVAYVGPVGVPVLFAHALLTACVDPAEDATSNLPVSEGNITPPQGGSGAPGGGEGVALTDPSFLLFLGLGIALVAAVAMLFVSSSGDDPEPESEPAEPDTQEDVRAVARAAGDAADRIEATTDVENEVYRAWREMTTHLDVDNPDSSTPAEFAAAAVDAGMEREHVDELTGLFEAVRYGGEAPTEEREERALAALRQIEREYADADARDAGSERSDQPGGEQP